MVWNAQVSLGPYNSCTRNECIELSPARASLNVATTTALAGITGDCPKWLLKTPSVKAVYPPCPGKQGRGISLQEKLGDRYQLGVTVCHYPTGASKWNPIEHRLFSEISKHWSAQPLSDYETIVRLIRGTRTQTGLVVNCTLNTRTYPTEVRVSNPQMNELDLLLHPRLPEWNYTLLPRPTRN